MLGADSQAALKATRKTKGASGQYLVDLFHKKIRLVQRQHTGVRIGLRWTPGHVGVTGNERADEEAKKAAKGESSPNNQIPKSCQGKIPKSRAAEAQRQQKEAKKKATTLFSKLLRYQCMHEIDPTMPSAKFRKDTTNLSRGRAALLAQLRMGHAPLTKHLHRIGKSESPACPACLASNESVHHYLIACPAWAAQRRQMGSVIGRTAGSIRTLLSHPKVFEHLFQFINKTGRFKSVFGTL